MNDWLIILISFGGVVYLLGGVAYVLESAFNESFLCRTYGGATTKVGFIIFLMIDIIMLPWTLMYCLGNGIVILVQKIIFKE